MSIAKTRKEIEKNVAIFLAKTKEYDERIEMFSYLFEYNGKTDNNFNLLALEIINKNKEKLFNELGYEEKKLLNLKKLE